MKQCLPATVTHADRPAEMAIGGHENVAPYREILSDDVLLSHTIASAVPSALRGLASGFGMGPGVSLSLWPPKHY